ncbi:MAG TPA: squalene synthase HpnC [Vicinamibacterales bacterium]
MPPAPDLVERAYAACEALAKSHYENFPVASWLLPAPMRRHVSAVYAYARIADDIADEGTVPAEERRVRLDAWQRRLHAAVAREQTAVRSPQEAEGAEAPGLDGGGAGAPGLNDDLIVIAAAHSIRSLPLPIDLFDDLISAFAQDTTTKRYDSWTSVLDYCRRSANPVGRLVLRIAGYRDDRLDRSSDALCTALQLTNFWQDFGRDWRAGRLYVPREVAAARGAIDADLAADRVTPAWADALGECAAFTAKLFEQGRAVCDGVGGRLRYELRFTWLGGRRILEKVERARADALTNRPTLGARDAPLLMWRAMRW